jgi:hypothetical protein
LLEQTTERVLKLQNLTCLELGAKFFIPRGFGLRLNPQGTIDHPIGG